MQAIQKILVPVDFSACSEEAVAYAGFLASKLSASVEVIHAWHPPYDLGPFLGQLAITDPDTGEERSLAEFVEEQAREALDRTVSDLGKQGLQVKGHLVEGTPKRAIVRCVEDGDYDLVVLGTHGRTGLAHVLMGSVAEWVLRHVAVPVVTVRASTEAHEGVAVTDADAAPSPS
jgi:nucleotide-binding universal stress UspA family protein